MLSTRRAFTLIELSFVVVILGVLAAIVVGNITSHAVQTKEAVLKTLLDQIHSQFETFRQRHSRIPGFDPATGEISEAMLVTQMTSYLDVAGDTSDVKAGGYIYGPYFTQFPPSPANGRASILIVADGAPVPPADNTTGWIYKPQTGEFYANHPDYGPGVDW